MPRYLDREEFTRDKRDFLWGGEWEEGGDPTLNPLGEVLRQERCWHHPCTGGSTLHLGSPPPPPPPDFLAFAGVLWDPFHLLFL